MPSLGHFFLSHIPWLLFICCSSVFQTIWPGSEADFLKHIMAWKAALKGFLATTLSARWVGNLQTELILKDFHSIAGGEIKSSGKWPYSHLQELVNIHAKGELSSSSIKMTPLWLDPYLHRACFILQSPLAVPADKSPSSCNLFPTAEPNRQAGTTGVSCLLLMEMRTQGPEPQNSVHTRVWEFPGVLYLT